MPFYSVDANSVRSFRNDLMDVTQCRAKELSRLARLRLIAFSSVKYHNCVVIIRIGLVY